MAAIVSLTAIPLPRHQLLLRTLTEERIICLPGQLSTQGRAAHRAEACRRHHRAPTYPAGSLRHGRVCGAPTRRIRCRATRRGGRAMLAGDCPQRVKRRPLTMTWLAQRPHQAHHPAGNRPSEQSVHPPNSCSPRMMATARQQRRPKVKRKHQGQKEHRRLPAGLRYLRASIRKYAGQGHPVPGGTFTPLLAPPAQAAPADSPGAASA